MSLLSYITCAVTPKQCIIKSIDFLYVVSSLDIKINFLTNTIRISLESNFLKLTIYKKVFYHAKIMLVSNLKNDTFIFLLNMYVFYCVTLLNHIFYHSTHNKLS